MIRFLRKLLFPFAILYGGIISVRNFLFDKGILSSKSYDFPVICVGNLSVGGTGKSPMIEYLISLLKNEYRLATLSRGYKRSTTGFHLLSGKESAKEVGDEPLQFKTKFPDIQVAVDENRQAGIAHLRKLTPQPTVILLDDAYQHRKVSPGFTILLTAYDVLYAKDFMLPTGNLREPRKGANRAQIIVVTKCPPSLSSTDKKHIRNKLKPNINQAVFFASIKYPSYVTNGKEKHSINDFPPFTLVTGIANPTPLVKHLTNLGLTFNHLAFPDHHNFTEKELQQLSEKKRIVTTEKDFMRLNNLVKTPHLFYLPIQTSLMEKEVEFNQTIIQFLEGFT